MVLSEFKGRAVFRVRVDIGAKLTPPVEEGKEWVELREPSYEELLAAKSASGDPKKDATFISDLLPSLIVQHSFEATEGVPADPKDVVEILRSSATLYGYVVKTWQESLPLGRKSVQS